MSRSRYSKQRMFGNTDLTGTADIFNETSTFSTAWLLIVIYGMLSNALLPDGLLCHATSHFGTIP